MFDNLIKAVQDAVKAEIITVETADGPIRYSTRPLNPLAADRSPDPICVRTLTAIVNYVERNIDEQREEGRKMFVHVVSPVEVQLLANLRNANIRDVLVEANYNSPQFSFGAQYQPGDFITKLQALFVANEERERLQKFAASLGVESSVRLQDDGVKQETVVKKGLATAAFASFENPVELIPFRTFVEVEQPSSKFILRLERRGDEQPPTLALHEAENQLWESKAIEDIGEFFKTELPDIPVLA